MARVVFTDEELEQVDRICKELDPAEHELTKPYLEEITGSIEREFVTEHFRDRVRGELLAGLMGRAVFGTAIETGVLPIDKGETLEEAVEEYMQDAFLERYRLVESGGRPEYLDTGTRFGIWQYGLGYVTGYHFASNRILGETDRERRGVIKELESGHVTVVSSEGVPYPAHNAINALVDIASDRMFGSVERAYLGEYEYEQEKKERGEE